MAQERKGAILWKGAPTDVVGPELQVGDSAPVDFGLTANDFSQVKGSDMAGKPRIILSVPSLDTPVCDIESRKFNEAAGKIPGVEIYAVSLDLPFAQKRWCGAAGVETLKTLSDFKDRSFGPAFGVYVPSKGLLARAVFVIGKDDKIRHVEYVKDVGSEPNYQAALDAIGSSGTD